MIDFHDVSLIEELQLRRWARLNYLPAGREREMVHGIVREELTAMDRESHTADQQALATQQENREPQPGRPVGSRFVPLADYSTRVDGADGEVAGPMFGRLIAKQPQSRFAEMPPAL